MDIPIRKLFPFLLVVIAVLLAMNFFPESVSWTVMNRFDLDEEANVPTWFSTVLLFSGAMTAFLISIKKSNADGAERTGRRFWLGFAAVYCFLSVDEAARFHEWVNVATSIKWIYFYAPVAAVFFFACVAYFNRNKDTSLRNWIVGGLMVFATGGLFFETLYHLFHPLPPLVWTLEVVCEEGLEMIGTSMVLMGCLQEFQRLSELLRR